MTTRRHLYTLHVPTSSCDSADDDDLFCNFASAPPPFMGQIPFTHSTASAFRPRLMFMYFLSGQYNRGTFIYDCQGVKQGDSSVLFLVELPRNKTFQVNEEYCVSKIVKCI